ncbi:MAG: hypothetical protein ACYSW8_30060, partial [Planctomycetota bacterium]
MCHEVQTVLGRVDQLLQYLDMAGVVGLAVCDRDAGLDVDLFSTPPFDPLALSKLSTVGAEHPQTNRVDEA